MGELTIGGNGYGPRTWVCPAAAGAAHPDCAGRKSPAWRRCRRTTTRGSSRAGCVPRRRRRWPVSPASSAELWSQQHVAALTSAPKLIRHPLVGELDLQCDVMMSPATGHRLIIFRPRPGSDSHEQIAFLDVLGNHKFA